MSAGPARYLLKIAYNGRRYCGWQFNTGTRTVAGALQDAVSKFIGHGSLEKPGIVGMCSSPVCAVLEPRHSVLS